MELLLRVLVGIEEVTFEVDGDFKNLTVDLAGNFKGKTVDFVGELVLIFSTLDLKIGFTFKGVFHADVDSVGDFTGSSAMISGVLEGFFESFDNFG